MAATIFPSSFLLCTSLFFLFHAVSSYASDQKIIYTRISTLLHLNEFLFDFSQVFYTLSAFIFYYFLYGFFPR